MRRIYLFILLFISLSSTVFAVPLLTDLNYVLQSPPKDESPLALYSYLNTLYNRWNVLQVSTQNPNGNIDADYGQAIIYYNGSIYKIEIETKIPHGNSWVAVNLS